MAAQVTLAGLATPFNHHAIIRLAMEEMTTTQYMIGSAQLFYL